MKDVVILFLLLIPIASFSQNLIIGQSDSLINIRKTDSIISAYKKIKESNLLRLISSNEKKKDKNYIESYTFSKSDKKLLEIDILLRNDPKYSVYKYYYYNDSLIKGIIQNPKDTLKKFYFKDERLINTTPRILKEPFIFINMGIISRKRAYSYLLKTN